MSTNWVFESRIITGPATLRVLGTTLCKFSSTTPASFEIAAMDLNCDHFATLPPFKLLCVLSFVTRLLCKCLSLTIYQRGNLVHVMLAYLLSRSK